MKVVQSARLTPEQASIALRQGEIIAYPTESVWGLGCDPFNEQAVLGLLELKSRPLSKGLILVAGSVNHIAPLWRGLDAKVRSHIQATWPGPYTWVLPDDSDWMPAWICGQYNSVAVRISAHPVVQSLCLQVEGPIVSTSANPTDRCPARQVEQLHQYFPDIALVEGELGDLSQPTQIRDALTLNRLR